ncbi:polysaccharide pyruvyl transferase family protein [Halorarum salinum]|uniref:Polysaccharide pyruvyl transferase family protein n=1 Tax=Halorarum salinum TaxID=2743089 RepID=A0A7D5QIH5_9EURY|nr:polysaccharide pyruvyl transferase family protein [Halobaculum salinum]QLG63402.1 polysaccharide pyruvyl transferase family protein [Halobaculum salinum]
MSLEKRSQYPEMDILITDYHCASNRGDAAILEGELATLKEQFPDASITVMTEYPDAANLIHGVDAVPQRLVPFEVFNLPKNGVIASILLDAALQRHGHKLPFISIMIDRLDLQPYYDADLIISTGGQYITDIYFPTKIGVLAELWLGKLLEKPVVLYAQSLGPFDRKPYNRLARRVLNSVDLITTRDEKSKRNLEALGVNETPIHALTDAAFSMPLNQGDKPIEQKIGEEYQPVYSDSGPVVSISVRNWSHFESEGGENQYMQAVADVADRLIEDRSADILFASTCTGFAGYHTDDRVAAQQVINRMNDTNIEQTHILSGEYTPQQLVGVYETVDCHIGTRMHSNILSILAGTPFVAIGYQFKTEELMSQFEMSEYYLDIDGLAPDELYKTVEHALSNRGVISDSIEANLPNIRDKSKKSAKVIHDYLNLN